jgi:peptide/nickel transport system ATP-binding protein
MTPLLALRDLTVTYATEAGGLTAVRAVSFDLAAGEALARISHTDWKIEGSPRRSRA